MDERNVFADFRRLMSEIPTNYIELETIKRLVEELRNKSYEGDPENFLKLLELVDNKLIHLEDTLVERHEKKRMWDFITASIGGGRTEERIDGELISVFEDRIPWEIVNKRIKAVPSQEEVESTVRSELAAVRLTFQAVKDELREEIDFTSGKLPYFGEKVKMNLSVGQIALLFRLLSEVEILDTENLTRRKLTDTIASMFGSIGKESISPDSLYNKYSTIERVDVLTLRGKLNEALDILSELEPLSR